MKAQVFEIWVFLAQTPLLWLAVTVLAYLGAMRLYRSSGFHPVVNPVLLAVGAIIAVLWLTKTPYPTYFDGAKFVHFLIGPATVALAIPLHAQLGRLRAMGPAIVVALLAGSLTAICSALALGELAGGSRETVLSLAPKSATMPIALGVAQAIGGLPSLAAVAVAITGISGAIMARSILNAIGETDPAVRGFAVGITAHAIGTARALQVHETAGAFAALAMGLNGIATAVLVPVVVRLVG